MAVYIRESLTFRLRVRPDHGVTTDHAVAALSQRLRRELAKLGEPVIWGGMPRVDQTERPELVKMPSGKYLFRTTLVFNMPCFRNPRPEHVEALGESLYRGAVGERIWLPDNPY